MKHRWRRKWETDALTDGWSPIPTQIVSNEEYAPLPPTPAQQAVAHHLRELSRRNAKALGMTRRKFLGSSCGMAAAFLAMNEVFGRFFEVEPVEAREEAATLERLPQGQFIFDVQTHHVAAPRQTPSLLRLRSIARRFNPDVGDPPLMSDLFLENYIKEVFLDSDTTVAVISGLPSATERTNILPPDKIAETRAVVNSLAASRRIVTHGLIIPSRGTRDLDEMERQVRNLKVEAWKGYPGQLIDGRSWSVDDAKVAYPDARKGTAPRRQEHLPPYGAPLPGNAGGSVAPPRPRGRGTRLPGSQLHRVSLGAQVVRGRGAGGPLEAPRTGGLGERSVRDASEEPGADKHLRRTRHDVRGDRDHSTDAVWPHSGHACPELRRGPRALGHRFDLVGLAPLPDRSIPAFHDAGSLTKTFGYAPLTPADKARILGLNAAGVFGVDPKAILNLVPTDFVSRMKAAYLGEGPQPGLTQYGWVLDAS